MKSGKVSWVLRHLYPKSAGELGVTVSVRNGGNTYLPFSTNRARSQPVRTAIIDVELVPEANQLNMYRLSRVCFFKFPKPSDSLSMPVIISGAHWPLHHHRNLFVCLVSFDMKNCLTHDINGVSGPLSIMTSIYWFLYFVLYMKYRVTSGEKLQSNLFV